MSASDPYTYDLVSNPNYSMGLNDIYNPQYRHKFHGYPSGSLITIPQRYFGEEIKPGSFKITDTQNSKDVIIVDDKYGNLYSTNAEHSQSAGALSSSDNYVGNIFYDMGLAVITETGSWSGSIDYPQVTSASNFNLEGMRKFINAKTLKFLSIEGLYKSMGYEKRNPIYPQFTDHCFTGDYPVIPIDANSKDFEKNQLSFMSTKSSTN